MRVYDTEIKQHGDGWDLEITEYHDDHPEHPLVTARRWHARMVILDDSSPKVLNFNRASQRELFAELERIKDLFESASTAVLDAAAERSMT